MINIKRVQVNFNVGAKETGSHLQVVSWVTTAVPTFIVTTPVGHRVGESRRSRTTAPVYRVTPASDRRKRSRTPRVQVFAGPGISDQQCRRRPLAGLFVAAAAGGLSCFGRIILIAFHAA